MSMMLSGKAAMPLSARTAIAVPAAVAASVDRACAPWSFQPARFAWA